MWCIWWRICRDICLLILLLFLVDFKDKLLRLLFPDGLLDYFEIVHVTELPKGGVEIELEEYASIPKVFEGAPNYICHGFYDLQLIHDFPLRGDIFNL